MILFPAGPMGALTDTQISLDGFLQQVALDGLTWTVQSMDGWRFGGGVSTSFEDRASQHGTYDGPVYRRARIINFSGTALADSRVLAEQAAETLAAVMADGSLGTIAVASPVGVRWVNARLSDTPQADMISPVAFRWSLQFTAPDHRKYGEEVSAPTGLPGGGSGITFPLGAFFDFGTPPTTGTVTVTNNGTAPTEPSFEVGGPLLSGFQLTHTDTGRRLRYESSVGTDPVVVDCLEGVVTSGGQDRTGLLSVDEFFTIPPQTSATFQFSTLGAESSADPAYAICTVAPAYY